MMNQGNGLNRLRRLFPHISYMELKSLFEMNNRDVEKTIEILQASRFSSEMQRLTANINQITKVFHSNQFSLCSQRIQHLLHNNRYNYCNNFRDSWCYMMLASCQRELGRHPMALKNFELSDVCLRKMKEEEVKSVKKFHPQILDTMRWSLYHGIGMESRHINGRLERSVLYLNAALGVLKRILANSENISMTRKRRFLIGKATTFHNLGVLYSLMDEYSKAIEYYQKAADIWMSVNILKGLLYAFNNIGIIHQKLSQFDEAISSWEKVLNLSFLESKIYQPDDIVKTHAPLLIQVLLNMGGLFEHKKEYSQSLEFYSRAISIIETILPQNKELELRITYRLAALFDRLKKTKRSKKYYQQCVKILRVMSNVENSSETAKNPRMTSHPSGLNRIWRSNRSFHHHHHQHSFGQHASPLRQQQQQQQQHQKQHGISRVNPNSSSSRNSFQQPGEEQTMGNYRGDEIAVDAFISGAKFMMFQKKDLSFAKDYLNEAIQITNRKNMRFVGSNLLIALGEVYARMKEPTNAIKCWRKSLQLKLELVKKLPTSKISPSSSLPSLQPNSITPYFVSLQHLVDRLVEYSLETGNELEALKYAEVLKSVSLVVYLRKDESNFLEDLEKRLLEVHLPKSDDVTVHYYLYKPLDISEEEEEEKEGEDDEEEEEEEDDDDEICDNELEANEEEKKNTQKIVRWVVRDGRVLFFDVRDVGTIIEPYRTINQLISSFRGIRSMIPQVLEYLRNEKQHNQKQKRVVIEEVERIVGKEDEFYNEEIEMIKEELDNQEEFCVKCYELLITGIEKYFRLSKQQEQDLKNKSFSSTSISEIYRKKYHHRFSHRQRKQLEEQHKSEQKQEEVVEEVPHVIFIPHREIFQIPFSVLIDPKSVVKEQQQQEEEKRHEYLIEKYTFSISNSLHMFHLNRAQRTKIRQFRECFKNQNDDSLYNRLRTQKYASQIQFGNGSNNNNNSHDIFGRPRRRRISTSQGHKRISDGDPLFQARQQQEEEEEGDQEGSSKITKSLIKGLVIGDPFFKKRKIRRRRRINNEEEDENVITTEEDEDEDEDEEIDVISLPPTPINPLEMITPIEDYNQFSPSGTPTSSVNSTPTKFKRNDNEENYGSLPFAKKEVQAIPTLVSRSPTLLGTGQELVVVLVKKQATQSQLLNCVKDKHPQFMHIVTHAEFPHNYNNQNRRRRMNNNNDDDDLYYFCRDVGGGCLVFSNCEKVYAREIPSRWENVKGCEFVYLSCCGGVISSILNNTNGKLLPEEEQQQGLNTNFSTVGRSSSRSTLFDEGGSLVKPLFQLGIPCVISALYRVSDQVAYEICKGFYSNYFGRKKQISSSSSSSSQQQQQENEIEVRRSRITASSSSITPDRLRRGPMSRRVNQRYSSSQNQQQHNVFGGQQQQQQQEPQPYSNRISFSRRNRNILQQQQQQQQGGFGGGSGGGGGGGRITPNRRSSSSSSRNNNNIRQLQQREENQDLVTENRNKNMTKSKALRNSVLEVLKNKDLNQVLYLRRIPFLFGAFQVFGEHL